MRYGDELDRIPAGGLSRRQFLAAGRQHAARAAWLFLPGGVRPPIESDAEIASSHDAENWPDRLEG